jgi:hypothetical protein
LAKAVTGVTRGAMKPLVAPLSLGELIDRWTVLEIKAQRISTPSKRAHVRRERDALGAIAAPFMEKTPALGALKARLKRVNRLLWDCEARSRSRFGRAPTSAAKAAALLTRIARMNDLRHKIKQRISRAGGLAIVEHKSYY